MKSNVALVCKGCIAERKVAVQKQCKGKSLESFIGKFVKRAFTDGEYVEHMWVSITGVSGDILEGTLVNEPVLVSNFQNGDTVYVYLDEVEEIWDGPSSLN